jgi:hypothetical protein
MERERRRGGEWGGRGKGGEFSTSIKKLRHQRSVISIKCQFIKLCGLRDVSELGMGGAGSRQVPRELRISCRSLGRFAVRWYTAAPSASVFVLLYQYQ